MGITYGSLFAGIGGFDLGFDRAGMTCKWQVEIDDYAHSVLQKNWPSVRRHRDVRKCGHSNLSSVDVVCGGFPCQDISSARTGDERRGLAGDSSGLWFEYLRIIRELRPRVVVIENVSRLVGNGLQRILCDLAELRCHVGWRVFCSGEFGFPFMRKRLFVVASTNGDVKPVVALHEKVEDVQKYSRDHWQRSLREVAGSPRVFDGVSNRTHRCRGVGNAVVPAISEWIGRKLLKALEVGENA